MCSPTRETPTWETRIPSDMSSPTMETHFLSDMCSPTWETHIPSDNYVFPTRSSCVSSELLMLWEIFSPRESFLFLFCIRDQTICFVICI